MESSRRRVVNCPCASQRDTSAGHDNTITALVHDTRTELNRTDLHQVDPVTRRAIGYCSSRTASVANQLRDADARDQ